MAKIENENEMKVYAQCDRLFLLFFPIVCFKRVGDMSVFYVFGIPVYKRVGNTKSILGFKWSIEDECDCSNCRYTREFGGFMVCLNREPVPMPKCKP